MSAPKRKRLKWEPAALMALVLGLGLWIAFGPASRPSFDTPPDAVTQQVRIGNQRGLLAAYNLDAEPRFRLYLRGQPDTTEFSRAQAEEIFGRAVIADALSSRGNWVFRTMNITSWVGVVWLGIGLLGQIAFSGRMVLQWIVSERRRQSIITESFWWFSMAGSLLLFSYFVWRQDPVAMLGQASGIVIYSRNLRLIYKKRRRDAREAATFMDDPAPEPTLDPGTIPHEEQADRSATTA